MGVFRKVFNCTGDYCYDTAIVKPETAPCLSQLNTADYTVTTHLLSFNQVHLWGAAPHRRDESGFVERVEGRSGAARDTATEAQETLGAAAATRCCDSASWSSWRSWSQWDDQWRPAPDLRAHQTSSQPSGGNPSSGLVEMVWDTEGNSVVTHTETYQNLYNYGSSPFSLLTVAVVQAEAAITQAQFPGPVWSRQAGWDPASVVPAAVGLWVHLQARLQKWQLGNVNLLNFILVPGADIKKQEHKCPPPFQLTIKNCNTENLQLEKELVMV